RRARHRQLGRLFPAAYGDETTGPGGAVEVDRAGLADVLPDELGDGAERALAAEGGEQTAGVGKKGGASGQVRAVGDVPEAPHTADDVLADALRPRIALEHAAVEEADLVVALLLGRGVEGSHAVHERLGIVELLEHGGQQALVVA